ncbi:MAG: hypothetical protein ACOC29_03785, partial [Candidatus Sumerlaeota bacterium]
MLAALGNISGWNFFQPWLAWLSLPLSVLLPLIHGRRLAGALRRRMKGALDALIAMPIWVSPVVLFLGAFLLFRFFVFAASPSYQYDILEYHEPIVRHILQEGDLTPVEGIAYSKMPWGAHLLYAWGTLFIGDLVPSPHKLINVWLGLAAAFVVSVGMAKWRLGLAFRLLAAGIFLAHPLTEMLLSDAYVGMAQALYVTAAAIFLLRAIRLPNRLDPVLAAV